MTLNLQMSIIVYIIYIISANNKAGEKMIGNKIKTRRKELNITQEELAKMTGYTTRSTINKIEQEINDIPLSKVSVFAKALNTTPSYLMGWEDEINVDMDMRNNSDTISNNIGSDSMDTNNTYTTNNCYSSSSPKDGHPCSKITSMDLFYEVLMILKDMNDKQLEDMKRYGEFIKAR